MCGRRSSTATCGWSRSTASTPRPAAAPTRTIRRRSVAPASSSGRTRDATTSVFTGHSPRERASEHAVVVGRLVRDRLYDVPVLDDLAALQLEDVHDGRAARARLAHRVDVEDHIVTVREHALDLAPRLRKLLLEEAEEGFEPLGPVGRSGVVLDVAVSEVLGR